MLRGSLLVCLLVAPLASALPPVVAPVEACGASCPCEDSTDAPATVDHDAPDDESCPDDCSDCQCGSRAVVALASVPTAESREAATAHVLLAPIDRAALGAMPGVFRPPRA